MTKKPKAPKPEIIEEGTAEIIPVVILISISVIAVIVFVFGAP